MRKKPTLQEKLSAALLALDECRVKLDPSLQALVDREKAKTMTPVEIERAMNLEWDHYPVPVVWGGTNHPTNLKPLRKADHRDKTNKKDAKVIAKVKRIARTEKFVVKKPFSIAPDGAVLVHDKNGGDFTAKEVVAEIQKRKKKWPSRPFATSKKDARGQKVSRRSSWPTRESSPKWGR